MKAIVPWFCLVAVVGSEAAQAADALEAYRQGNYNLAAKTLVELGSKDPVADYYLGRMRLYGYGELKNNQMALKYFTQAASKGYLPAQQLLGRYYLNEAKDPAQALLWFKKAAEADNTPALMYCAAAYLFGYGVKENSDTARRFYIEAAKNGDAIAQYTLADQFLTSKDSRNRKLGLIWLTKSAEQGNAKAQAKLGEMYIDGVIVNKDFAKAQELLQLAAAQNEQSAYVGLGDLAKKQTNLTAAKDWYTRAADAGNIDGQLALAKFYSDAANPEHNAESAFMWMLKAAQNDSVPAQKAVAEMYQKGLGVTADANLAKQWQQTAEKTERKGAADARMAVARWLSGDKSDNFANSPYHLGGIYSDWHNPQALKENNYNAAPQMAVLTRKALYQPQFTMMQPADIQINDYFDILAPTLNGSQMDNFSFPRYPIDAQIASLQRHKMYALRHETGPAVVDDGAYYQPGEEYDTGNYLEDKVKGWQYQANMQAALSALYNKAILGESSSQFEIGQLYQYGIGVAQNIDQAITYYQLAAAQGDARAEYNLGVVYLEGKTNPVDYKKGVDWMMDAAFKGDAYAQFALANIYEKGLTDTNGNVVIKPNHEQALAMYYLASANDLGDAQYRLADYLVKQKQMGLSVAAKTHRLQLIKRLYEGAARQGIAEAVLPLAFYNAMDSDPVKQQQAFATAKKEATAGNSEAALLLGLMYDRGIAVQANAFEALYWYQQAAMNPVNAFILGTYYAEGKGVGKDLTKGRALLQQSADAGFSYANLNLAVLKHNMGEYFLPELDAARQQGNSTAGLLLADYYLQQASDPDKMKQAREIYTYFAEKGDKEAQLKLAFLYERGLGGVADNEAAAHWYNLAAEQGQPIAQFLLGQMYQLGRIGKEPDYDMARKWYQQAHAKYPAASVALGFMFDTVFDNYAQATENYQLAAQAKDAIGLYDLGLIYQDGKGVPVDAVKAHDYMQQSANLGYSKAMTQLANLYFNGINKARDEQQALSWYKKAAAMGDSAALYQLGLFAETGVATKLDFAAAVSYYQQAANLGNEKAQLALARMYQYGLGVPQDLPHAADIYKKLAADSNAYAQYQLGLLNINGLLGESSMAQGKILLQQASENGNNQAGKMLRWLNAQQETRLSFIEPVNLDNMPLMTGQSADMMYMDALNEWNRGDENLSRMILNRLMTQFPHYTPAKRAYEQLNQQNKAPTLG